MASVPGSEAKADGWTMDGPEQALQAVVPAAGAAVEPVAVGGSRRLQSIDALRGAAALAVVVYHAVNAGVTPPASATWYPALSELADLGRTGVPLFFVLSGFCIHAGWARRRAGGVDESLAFGPFWKRRLVRLYPPYLVALLFSMAIVVATALVRPELPLVASYPEPRAAWIGGDLAAHLFMLHGLHPAFDRAGGNAPFWTLAREEYFYLMYFGLLAVRRRVGPVRAVLGASALGLVFPYLFRPFLDEGSPWWGVINTSSISLWGQWCLGLLAAEAHHGLVKLPAFTRDLRLVPVWAAVALALGTVTPVGLTPLAWGMTFFTLVNAFVAREQRWGQAGVVRWFAGLGLFSYSLYLIHHPVRGLVKRLFESWIARGDLVVYLAANAVVVLVAVLVARVFFDQVERRFLAHREG